MEERKESSLLRVVRGPANARIDEFVHLPIIYVRELRPLIPSNLSTNFGSNLDVVDDVGDDLGQDLFLLLVVETRRKASLPPTEIEDDEGLDVNFRKVEGCDVLDSVVGFDGEGEGSRLVEVKGRTDACDQADLLQRSSPDPSFFPNDEDPSPSAEEGDPIPGSTDGDRTEDERESDGSEGLGSEEEGRDVLVRGRRRGRSGGRRWVAEGELENLREDLDGEGGRLRGGGGLGLAEGSDLLRRLPWSGRDGERGRGSSARSG